MSASPGAASRIVVRSLSHARTDGSSVFSNAAIAFGRLRYGLVGDNGSGKSTLLRAIAGEIAIDEGFLRVDGQTAYLPQRRALASTLSGGEYVRGALERIAESKPDWLLLDEPTNHLDCAARARLCGFIRNWAGGIIIASHDRELLEHVDEIVAIERGRFVRYGGNFSFYDRERDKQRQAAERDVRAAESRLSRERRDLGDQLDRASASAAAGKRRAQRTGLSKIERGSMKRNAQRSAASNKRVHEERVDEARERIAQAQQRIECGIRIAFDARHTAVGATQLVAACEELNVRFDDGSALWARPHSFTLRGPVRGTLRGRNGSGKTLLLRALAGDLAANSIEGSLRVAVPFQYLDQHLCLLDPYATAADAMHAYAPHLREHERRTRLARAGFAQKRGTVRIETLSGGERMRLAIAVALAREPVPQLLLLDEPSNDLDLHSLRELAQTLRNYAGALLVVSHDEAFLRDAEIGECLELPLRPGEKS